MAELPRIDVVRLQHDDILVLHAEQVMSNKQVEDIAARAKERFPDQEVIVIDGGMKLSVVRKDGV